MCLSDQIPWLIDGIMIDHNRFYKWLTGSWICRTRSYHNSTGSWLYQIKSHDLSTEWLYSTTLTSVVRRVDTLHSQVYCLCSVPACVNFIRTRDNKKTYRRNHVSVGPDPINNWRDQEWVRPDLITIQRDQESVRPDPTTYWRNYDRSQQIL